MYRFKLLIVMFAMIQYFSLVSNAQQLKLATKPVLTLEVVKAIAKSTAEYATRNKWDIVIAIVDDGGHLLYLERMDGVQTGSIDVAIQKAKTAAAFKRKSKVFLDALKNGRPELVSLPGGIPFDGGVPLIWNEQVIGAIGVSGMTTGDQDGMIAEFGSNSMANLLK
jgi:glc operon protein GlcG